MNKLSLLFVFALAACGDSNVPIDEANASVLELSGTDRYIVILKDDADVLPVIGRLSKKHGFQPDLVFKNAVKGFAGYLPPRAVKELQSENDVKYVEADDVVSINARPSTGGGGTTTCSSEPAQVISYGTTRVGGPVNASGKVAWVIDTGIQLNNCDLNVDVIRSKNFVTVGANSPDDKNGHGTHVAGIIAAKNNTIDTVGVAESATVVAVRVLDSRGSGYISWIVAGVDYVTSKAAPGDVANMSLGASGHYQSLHDAVYNSANSGVLYSLAAGNDSGNAADFEPAHTEHPNVYTVSAIGSGDVFAWFSNWGNPPIDFAAPGVEIVSLKKGGGVTSLSGTSMAAPHVAGLLLLGTVVGNGYVVSDPDGNPDKVAHH